jgi:catechol 2,3-dioxygenase-like lactoylglutathione lyase family enzyme
MEDTMPLGRLQHYTIEPQDLERTKNFYCDVLGLENGVRSVNTTWKYGTGRRTACCAAIQSRA